MGLLSSIIPHFFNPTLKRIDEPTSLSTLLLHPILGDSLETTQEIRHIHPLLTRQLDGMKAQITTLHGDIQIRLPIRMKGTYRERMSGGTLLRLIDF